MEILSESATLKKNGDIVAYKGKDKVTIDKEYGNFTHGYYTTSPSSQGKSVNRVIIMQGTSTGKAASKEQFYVSASRGKFAISVHTDDKEHLMKSVQNSSQRDTRQSIQLEREQSATPHGKNEKNGFHVSHRGFQI